ncbi:hypothetical protein LWI29_035686 [Acer saccharum]|uniref:Uncharacterized protein n=1 Tax=Acer saccharum TaxID=4024 RepID=A0AA39T8E8_ACESA|nr:hypothetical protein LWI29_034829 [Acer saccharum]KAK0602651.1 hypothetical protein LWI29_035686 [Acer saccharum]
MIPVKYLLKIGVYEVEFQGAKVKASVVDDEAVLDAKINQLWTSVRNQKCPVVGVDFKLDTVNERLFSLTISIDGIVEACELVRKVLKKPNLCKCGLAELVKEVAAALPSSFQLLDLKVKEEKANLTELIWVQYVGICRCC